MLRRRRGWKWGSPVRPARVALPFDESSPAVRVQSSLAHGQRILKSLSGMHVYGASRGDSTFAQRRLDDTWGCT